MKRLTRREKLAFYQQLASLLRAGAPLDDAVDLMAAGRNGANLSKFLKEIAFLLREGQSLSSIARKYPETFSPYECEMIFTSEFTSDLDASLDWLGEFQTRDFVQSREARLDIGFFLLEGMSLFTVYLIFSFWVIPVFHGIFSNFGAALPPLTQLIIDLNQAFRDYFLVGVILFALAAVFIRALIRRRPLLFSAAVAHIPWLGERLVRMDAFRFALVAGRLLESGVPGPKAVEASADLIGSAYLKSRLKNAGSLVRQGCSWADALKKIEGLPRSIIAFAKLGETWGELDQALREIAQINIARERDRPRWIFFWASSMFVAFILLMLVAMYLPIFEIAGAVGG
ncbi:MAG: hypothetical protein GY859_04155 [Desulfobacterales bacterium]|nr:hypothetical protein [Desulfobacterales bacterium]